MSPKEPKPKAHRHSPAFLKLVDDALTRVPEVTVEQVREKQRDKSPFRFIDVREDTEWEEGYCMGAEHLARGILERDVEKLIPDKGAEVVLYCGGGFRSALAGDNLRRMGYKKVFSMAGGFRAWLAAHGPVVRGSHDHRKI